MRAKISNAQIPDAKGRHTPYDYAADIRAPGEDDIDLPHTEGKYHQLVGDLRYLIDRKRPDLVFVKERLAMASHRATVRHWQAMRAVIRYLKYTIHYGITYHGGQSCPPLMKLLQGYCDTSFGGDMADRRSTSGMVICYNGSPIHWASKKQTMVVMSTAEDEYISLAAAAQRFQATRRLCRESGLMAAVPCRLKKDNLAVVEMLEKPHGTKRRKFIDLRNQLLQQLINTQAVQALNVRAVHQKADLLAKVLQRVMLTRKCTAISCEDTPPAGGDCGEDTPVSL